MGLTKKQNKFCEEYLVDLNATQAAIRAGYSVKTARSQGQRLLTNVDIQEFIQKKQKELSEKTEITKERVLAELKLILEAKITDYLTFNGKQITFKSFEELSDNQLKAIEGIKHTRYGIELKLHGKSWTIERICKMLGFDSPKELALNIDKILDSLPEQYLDLIIEKIVGNGKN